MAETVSKEKGVDKEDVVAFIEEGIEVALRKTFPEGAKVQVEIDRVSGNLNAWRLYKLVDQIENVEGEMLFNEVEDEEVADGYVWESFEPTLSRQQFNVTRQVAIQKLKQKSKLQHIEDMLTKQIKIFTGVVRGTRKESITIDHGGFDLIMPRKHIIFGEQFKPGDRIRFTIVNIDGQYVASRTANEFLVELFKEEVSQIEDGDIQIVYCARNPGFKAKVVVKSKNSRIDAVRFTIGAKGSHIKNIQQELKTEFIDVLQYEYDPAQMLIRALSPAIINRIVMDEDEKVMEIAVDDEYIGQVLGKYGKNIELVSNLIGWTVKVYSEDQWESRKEFESEAAIYGLIEGLNVDKEMAQYIYENGFDSIEEIAFLSNEELNLEELDDETLLVLKKNAKDSLANPSVLNHIKNINELVALGFYGAESELLIANKVYSKEDVADLSTYDLTDIIEGFDEERAKKIILLARA